MLAVQLHDDALLLPGQESTLASLCNGFGGTMLDSGQGDLRLVLFGLPKVRADDSERALRCALQLLDWAAEQALSLAIGLGQGPLQLQHPQPEQPPRSATGPALQESRRLVVLADGPGLWIGEALYRAYRPHLEARRCVTTGGWQVSGYRPQPAGITPFVGRRLELQQLGLYLQGVHEAGCAHIVYIRGDAGIGKSRLLEQLGKRAEAEGFQHREPRCCPRHSTATTIHCNS
ncbi:AAA family ATPase [Marinobacterium aestuariivivens]|uniref:AAA family ATPase n=1 Tax=Marinobacterium aestuariivivens TaxID=1698799 RepID=A0ABW1ZZ93_9GAMM